MISFTVAGVARTAGSKRAFALRRRDGSLVLRQNGSPVVNVTDDNPKSKDWKALMAWTARSTVGAGFVPLRGALEVEFTFIRARPAGHFRKNGELSKNGLAMLYPTTRPDATKLLRAAEDSLTGVLWLDDSQIVTQRVLKRWGEAPGVRVTIKEATA